MIAGPEASPGPAPRTPGPRICCQDRSSRSIRSSERGRTPASRLAGPSKAVARASSPVPAAGFGVPGLEAIDRSGIGLVVPVPGRQLQATTAGSGGGRRSEIADPRCPRRSSRSDPPARLDSAEGRRSPVVPSDSFRACRIRRPRRRQRERQRRGIARFRGHGSRHGIGRSRGVSGHVRPPATRTARPGRPGPTAAAHLRSTKEQVREGRLLQLRAAAHPPSQTDIGSTARPSRVRVASADRPDFRARSVWRAVSSTSEARRPPRRRAFETGRASGPHSRSDFPPRSRPRRSRAGGPPRASVRGRRGPEGPVRYPGDVLVPGRFASLDPDHWTGRRTG